MFDTLLIITLFLLASFPVCLLTSRLLFLIIVYFTYVSLPTDINGYFEIPPPPPGFIKFNKDLQTGQK